MYGIYDLEWNLISGPFDSPGTALFYAIENGLAPFKIEEM